MVKGFILSVLMYMLVTLTASVLRYESERKRVYYLPDPQVVVLKKAPLCLEIRFKNPYDIKALWVESVEVAGHKPREQFPRIIRDLRAGRSKRLILNFDYALPDSATNATVSMVSNCVWELGVSMHRIQHEPVIHRQAPAVHGVMELTCDLSR